MMTCCTSVQSSRQALVAMLLALTKLVFVPKCNFAGLVPVIFCITLAVDDNRFKLHPGWVTH